MTLGRTYAGVHFRSSRGIKSRERKEIFDAPSALRDQFSAGGDDREYPGLFPGAFRLVCREVPVAHRPASPHRGNLIRDHPLLRKASEESASLSHVSGSAASKDHNKGA